MAKRIGERGQPGRGWLMAQSWHDLLFAHWPVDFDQLQRVVPPQLIVDTLDGQAWLGVIAFRISDIHLRGLPPLPGVSAFPEVNLRTYVTLHDRPGVLFLSLHCPNRLGMALARPWFRLPYRYADVNLRRATGTALEFTSCSPDHADLSVMYWPCSEPALRPPDSLEAWLTERYSYYSGAASGSVYRCDIQHPPWRLAQADACFDFNTLARPFGIQLPKTAPLLLVAEDIQAHIWGLKRVA